jgi:hypothetical protein
MDLIDEDFTKLPKDIILEILEYCFIGELMSFAFDGKIGHLANISIKRYVMNNHKCTNCYIKMTELENSLVTVQKLKDICDDNKKRFSDKSFRWYDKIYHDKKIFNLANTIYNTYTDKYVPIDIDMKWYSYQEMLDLIERHVGDTEKEINKSCKDLNYDLYNYYDIIRHVKSNEDLTKLYKLTKISREGSYYGGTYNSEDFIDDIYHFRNSIIIGLNLFNVCIN